MRRTFPIAVTLIALACVSALQSAPFRFGSQSDSNKKIEPTDRARIVEEIKSDLNRAVDRLQERDAGAQTQSAQDRILKNIDRLLEEEDPLPPSSGSNAKSPPPSPPPPSSPPPGAKPESKPSSSQNDVSPKPMPSQPQASESKRAANTGERDSLPRTAADTVKEKAGYERWGDLSSKARMEIDAHLRERFIRNYEELSRHYYRALAESGKREE